MEPYFCLKKKNSLRNAYIELILVLAYKSANHFCQPRALSVHAKQTLHKEVPIPPPFTDNLGSPVRTKSACCSYFTVSGLGRPSVGEEESTPA